MSHEHTSSYPSPSAGQVGEGAAPFYTQQGQQRIPDQEDIEIGEHLSRDLVPNTQHMVHDAQRMNQRFTQQIHTQNPQQHIQQHFHAMPHVHHGVPLQPHVTGPDPKVDDGSARKKSKASRACDECRRKKIKCDATSDAPGHDKCSNCNRTSNSCGFSRQPMKRGPSKGYIKELADRVESMERQYKHVVGAHVPSPGANDFAMGQDLAQGRKRTHSMSENPSGQAYVLSQLDKPNERYQDGGWSGPGDDVVVEPRHSQPYDLSKAQAPTANMNYNTTMQDITSPANGLSVKESAMGQDYAAWKEALMEEYFRVVHPVIPLLANTVDELRAMIRLVPGIHEGFYVALSMIVGRLSATSPHPHTPTPGTSKFKVSLNTLINSSLLHPTTDAAGDAAKLLVYLQAYIMVVMAMDMDGALYQHDDVHQRVFWFGLATNMVQRLKLHQTQEQDTNPNDMLAVQKRRAYLAIVVVDCFEAAGIATPLHFQNHDTQLLLSDMAVVGESFYYLVSVSRVLSHLLPLATRTKPVFGAAEDLYPGLLHNSLAGEFRLVYETLNPHLGKYPVVHAGYLHLQIFIGRVLGLLKKPSDFLSPSRALCHLLDSNQYIRNPWTHHFVALAGHTLMEVAEYPQFKGKAQAAMSELCHAIKDHSIMATYNTHGWKPVLYKALKANLEALEADPVTGANLQHLAEAAAGGEGVWEGAEGEKVTDWSKVVHQGYLTAFGN